MAHIRQIAEDEATGLLEQIYAAGRSRAGGVANIIRIMSLDAESTQASMRFYLSLMKRPNALMPTTAPRVLKSGPPELPGLIEASV